MRKNVAFQQVLADVSMLAVAFVWGTTFQLVKDALADIGTFPFLAVRFLLATLFLLPFQRVWHWHPAVLRAGIYLMGGYALQTFGLIWTTPGKAAFITGLSVVLVPLFTAWQAKRLPDRATTLGAVLAAAGLGLLTLDDSLVPGKGDLLVFICSVFFALQILAVGNALKEGVDPGSLTIIQLGVVGFLSLGLWWACGGGLRLSTPVIVAIGITSVLATTAAFLVQGWAQKYTTPNRVALSLSMEPVFAAIFSYFFGSEVFTLQKLLGSVLVFLGIIAGIVFPTGINRRQEVSGAKEG